MPNYNIQNCTSGDTYVVSATSLSVGEIISFNIGETALCGTVLSVTSDPITSLSLYNSSYTDCCDCLLTTIGDTGLESFRFNKCGGDEELFITLSTFCRVYGDSPTSGQVFRLFNIESGESICATSLGTSVNTGVSYWEPDEGPFTTCDECTDKISRSANTETELCVVCSGTTSSVVPPHAVYSDGFGNPVTQLNTVVLGGPNGLNN